MSRALCILPPQQSLLKIFYILTILMVLYSATGCIPEKHPIPKIKQSSGQSAETLKKWSDQKFSMFIHFGLYALPAGVWKEKQVTKGYSEQIRAHGKISREDYRTLAASFNPTKWNPDSIALLAKAAGMKSVVITAKHHDGFALFKTKWSKFNSVDGTPYQNDLLAGLAAACRRQGLNFGIYFSLIDWDFNGALPPSSHNSDSIPPAHHQLNLGQVTELLTGYGPVSEIWFDMGKPTEVQSREIAQLVRTLQPDCMISGRLWNDQGDFAVMGDNASPDFRMGQPWQTPASMFDDTWGYRSWQVRNDPQVKAVEKLKALIRTIANGGNYLLNIGPTGEGSVVPFEKEVLLKIGNWIKMHQRELLQSRPESGQFQNWGVITAGANTLNLFILSKPDGNSLVIKGLYSDQIRVSLKSNPQTVIKTKSVSQGTELIFDKNILAADDIPVIKLELKEKPVIEPSGLISSDSKRKIELNRKNATAFHSYSGQDYYSTKPTVIRLEWNIRSKNSHQSAVSFLIPEQQDLNPINLIFNNHDHFIESKKLIRQNGNKIFTLKNLILKSGLNTISIQLADQSNPNRDLELEAFNIIIQ